MGRPPVTTEIDRHTTCRNLSWERGATGEGAVPGKYCLNRLGVIHAMDCPVYQGLECCLFDPRAADEDPVLTAEEEMDHLRMRLVRDYLRWPYWKRVGLLRAAEAPGIVVHDLPDVIEPEPDDDDSEPVRLAKREEPPEPAKKPEGLPEERYPGQRRSEDRRRNRRAGEEPSPPEDDDGSFAAGILSDVEAAGEEAFEPGKAESSASAGAAPATEKGEERDQKQRSRRRRPRRRRGRGRGKGRKPEGGEKGRNSG